LNITVTVQLAPAASVLPQVLPEIPKPLALAPETDIPERSSAAVPVLVIVVDIVGPTELTTAFPKANVVAESEIPGTSGGWLDTAFAPPHPTTSKQSIESEAKTAA
jgi:hypothetical protein